MEFSPQLADLSGRTLWYAATCCGSSLSGEGYDGWDLRHWCFYVPFPSSRWDRDVVGRAPRSSPGGAAQWPHWGPALPTLTGWWSLEKEKQILVAKWNIPCFPKHKHWTSLVAERKKVSSPHPQMPRVTPCRGQDTQGFGKSLPCIRPLTAHSAHSSASCQPKFEQHLSQGPLSQHLQEGSCLWVYSVLLLKDQNFSRGC